MPDPTPKGARRATALVATWALLASCGDAATPATQNIRTTSPTGDMIEVEVPSGKTIPIAAIPNGPLPPLPEGAQERIVRVGSHRIFAIEIPGEEPAVVLAHGFPDNLHLYDRLYPLLRGRRVVAFDFLGWGRSEKPTPTIEYAYTTAAQVEELATVLSWFDLSNITLVVHDQSAPVGLDYLRRDQSRVGELVLLNGFYALSPNLSPPKGIEIHADPQLDAVELAVEGDPAATEAFYRFQMNEFINVADDEEAMIDTLWALFPEARPAFVALNDVLFAEVFGRLQTFPDLASIVVPTDIVQGDADPYLTTEVAREFHEILPNSTLTVVENAGHFVQIDAPEAVAAAILQR